MKFNLNPANQVIDLRSFENIASDFVRLVQFNGGSFGNFVYETVNFTAIQALESTLNPGSADYFKGIKIIPTLRTGNDIRLVYVPTLAEVVATNGSIVEFSYSTDQDPFDLIANNDAYWVVNGSFQSLSSSDKATAAADLRNYRANIRLAHDGDESNPSPFVLSEDINWVFATFLGLFSIVNDNPDGSNNLPTSVNIVNVCYQINGVYRHMIAETVYSIENPDGTSANGLFSNAGADHHIHCPSQCFNLFTDNFELVLA